MFELYLKEGIKHITDLQGYDHIAFLVSLLAGYSFKDIKKVIVLVTAFTIGHSITLALSAVDKILISSSIIEFLIPVTIFFTALYHLLQKKTKNNQVIYWIALFFGFIHGAGFSNYFKSLMGRSANILTPLLGFNIGVEIGQFIIVAIILVIAYVIVQVLSVKQRIWQIILSSIAILISINLMIQTWPF